MLLKTGEFSKVDVDCGDGQREDDAQQNETFHKRHRGADFSPLNRRESIHQVGLRSQAPQCGIGSLILICLAFLPTDAF